MHFRVTINLRRTRIGRITLILLAYALLICGNVYGQGTSDARQLFARAQEQFKAKRYDEAYSLFRKVEALGFDAPILQFNIGSAALKSARLLESREAFLKASVATRFEALSYFNLGLVAVKRGKRSEALSWFTRAYGSTSIENLRRLCVEMSARLIDEAEHEAAAAQDWLYFVSGGVGYEDTSIDPVDDTVRSGNFFAETNTFIQRRFFERERWGVMGRGEFFATFNDSTPDLNFVQMGAAVEPYLDRESWRASIHTSISSLYLDGAAYETVLSSGMRIAQTTKAFNTGFRYTFFYHEPASDFPFLEGSQHEVRIDGEKRWIPWLFRSHVVFEYNDRVDPSDISESSEYTRFSPSRQQIGMELQWSGVVRHEFAMSFDWRASLYEEENGVDSQREENRARARTQWRYRSSRYLVFVTQWEYTDNDVTLEGYSYSRNQFRVGCELSNI